MITTVAFFAGCGNSSKAPIADDVPSPFVAYNKGNDSQIKLGDNRELMAEQLGPNEFVVVEFEEDNLERVNYYENEDVYLDYDPDGVVRAIRLEDKNWTLFNGLKVGSSSSEVREQYEQGFIHKIPENDDLWVSYDKNGDLTKFDMDSSYFIRFNLENGSVKRIIIQDNTIYISGN